MRNETAHFERDVFPAELRDIGARRRTVGQQPPPAGGPHADNGLVGLALSGGGIRSATFGLGAIQALAQAGVFQSFDYLSTVSGGGFIGASVSSLMNDAAYANDRSFPLLPTIAGGGDSQAVRHVRNSGNYLAPGGTLDRIRIPALMARGILLNVLAVMPYLILAAVATQLWYDTDLWNTHQTTMTIAAIGLRVFPLVGFVLILMTFPVVIRVFGSRLSWSTRNRYEALVAVFFMLSLAAILGGRFFWLIDRAINTEFSAFLDSARSTSIDPSFIRRIVATVATLSGLAAAAGFSAQAKKLRAIVGLYAVGLLGPLAVIGTYLILCMLLIDSNRLDTTVISVTANEGLIWDLDNRVLPAPLARTPVILRVHSGATNKSPFANLYETSGVVYEVVETDGVRQAWLEAATLPATQADLDSMAAAMNCAEREWIDRSGDARPKL